MTDTPDGMLERALEPYPEPRSSELFRRTAENRGAERPRSFSFCQALRDFDAELDRRRAEEAGR